jgi:hypothetical protein
MDLSTRFADEEAAIGWVTGSATLLARQSLSATKFGMLRQSTVRASLAWAVFST